MVVRVCDIERLCRRGYSSRLIEPGFARTPVILSFLTASGEGEALQVVFGLATSGVVFEPQTAEYFNDGESVPGAASAGCAILNAVASIPAARAWNRVVLMMVNPCSRF